MAAQCSSVYATWLSRFHRLMAEIAEADLAVRTGQAARVEDLVGAGGAVLKFYNAMPDGEIIEIEAIINDGLKLAQSFRRLVEVLRLSEGDPLFDLCDEIADHAEVLALSRDSETIARLESHLYS